MKPLKWILFTFVMLILPLAVVADAIFTDVNEDDWYYSCVSEMTELGALKGYPDGTFRPNNSISKSELVSIVVRLQGLKPEPSASSHWAAELMKAALDAGWYDWDEAPPTGESYDEPITRQLAVKIIMNAFAPDARGDYNTESAKMADFSQLDGRYYNAVLAAYSIGVAGGDDKGNFNPKSNLSRAEACALISRAMGKSAFTPAPAESESEPVAISGGVSENGRLRVEGVNLVNERGEPVVLRGMSTHGIQWFPQFLSREAIKSTADRGANLFRVAMYTAEGGYLQNPKVKDTLINAVDTAIGLDMYVIIDWHILSDGNPMTHIAESREFFAEMSQKYGDNPAVIYEICNEPNGAVSWSGDVKPYAEEIIGVIRENAPEAIVLVGSPTWSQDLHEAAKDPLAEENVMYTCHFYAGTHTAWLRDRITYARAQGLAVFVSEWGVSDASGGGGVYADEARVWLDYMRKNNISWANWSLCDKGESSAAVRPGSNIRDGIDDSELTESGKLVFSSFGG